MCIGNPASAPTPFSVITVVLPAGGKIVTLVMITPVIVGGNIVLFPIARLITCVSPGDDGLSSALWMIPKEESPENWI
jgi:hypothetical protein